MFFSTVLGVVSAQMSLVSGALCTNSSRITEYCLLLLLFIVGFDIGRDNKAFFDLLKRDKFAFLVPVGTIIGTLSGGVVASFFINLSLKDTLAVSAGFGWYSLSAVIITDVKGADLGSIAFLANVFREFISILTVPLIARYIGKYEAIAPGGATSMDTTLPIITKYAGSSAAIVAFTNGFILSALVPIMVPLFL